MKSPIKRICVGALLLLLLLGFAVVGYRVIGDYDWIEAIWIVVVTVSSVGYSEVSQSSTAVQLLTITVIVLGMTATAYTFTGFVQLVLAGEVERALGVRRMNRQIAQLEGHVIICGMGRTGRNLANDLHDRQHPFVIVERDPNRQEEAKSPEFLYITGDATEEAVLYEAGIERAGALVTVLPSDAANVFITLTARELNPGLLIIARAEYETTAKKLHQAGAQKVVMPARVGALQMVRMITHPSTADLMELMAETSYLDLELDELAVARHEALIGLTVARTEAHRTHRLLVVAVRQSDGKMVFNPDAGYAFRAGDIAILMGNRQDIRKFRDQYRS